MHDSGRALSSLAGGRIGPSAQIGFGAGLRMDEGALPFVTFMWCTYRGCPYKREWGRENDRRPSSKPARRPAADPPPPAPGAPAATHNLYKNKIEFTLRHQKVYDLHE